MTVDNRGGLATFSPDVNPNKIALIESFLVPGRGLELGCGSGQYGEAIARRCDELLQIDVVDRREPAARRFPFVAMNAADVQTLGRQFENVVALDPRAHARRERFLSAVEAVCSRRLLVSVPNAGARSPH
jgi:hypothetical protein